MEPEIEDISSQKIQSEISRLQILEGRLSWVRVVTLFGGLGSSLWLIYRVFVAHGIVRALLTFLGLSFVYKFGVSPMFAIAASALCFYFNAVGVWLPIISYLAAIILFFVDVKRDNLRRRVDPYKLASILTIHS